MNVYKLSSGDLIVLDKVERVIRSTESNGWGGVWGYILQIFLDSGKEITYKYNEEKERNEEFHKIYEQLRGQDSVLEHKEECPEEDKNIAERIYRALLGTEHIKTLETKDHCEFWVSRWRLEDLNRVFKEFGVKVEE